MTATGEKTELGNIARLAAAAKPPLTPLQRRLGSLSRAMIGLGLAVMVLLAAGMLLRGASLHEAFLVGVSVAVAAVPEGLAATVTIALAQGARTMAARGAIVRRLAAVETLGSASVIATDKTGTLTVNQLRVVAIEPAAGASDEDVLAAGVLASTAPGARKVRRSRPSRGGQRLQPAHRLAEHLEPLAEREPHEVAALGDVVVEDDVRHGHHPAPVGQLAAHLHAVLVADAAGVGGDEVGARGPEHLEPGLGQAVAEEVPLGTQVGGELDEVPVAQAQGDGGGVLERGAVDVGQELLGGADGGEQIGPGAHPADLPSREREALAVGDDGDGAIGHAGQRRHGDVTALVHEVLVDLVGDDEQVVVDGDVGDGSELLGVEHLARRVVRGVEEDEPGAVRDRGPQLGRVEPVVGGRSVTTLRFAPAIAAAAAYES